ncbi:MAG: glycoside hydrolase family 88 protein [Clostridia bacterium]|nr:glycoside hydrolase family 88 protein [Clostridia bacterium]
MINCGTDCKPIEYAKAACDTLMNKFTDPNTLPPAGAFHYHQGVFLSGMEQTYLCTGEQKYSDYIKGWVDSIIDENGVITAYNEKTLDDLRSGTLLFGLYDRTKDTRYEKPMHTIYGHLADWPKNKEGGFWHKFCDKDQMWLDGLYMAGPFLTMYEERFGKAGCIDEAVRQAELMWRHNRDLGTGLMYHAWDCEKIQPWANPETGCSPEFWGRAIGWYITALCDMLDYIPKDNENRDFLISCLTELAKALVKYQDASSGLWYQVVNRGDDKGNWTELSCSSLFTYGISKAARLSYIDKGYAKYALRGYEGVISAITMNDDGSLILPGICIGTGVGDYDFYIHRDTVVNDLHGMGAFTLMCCELERLLSVY